MAYMNQERKAVIAANLKLVVPKGWKYSLSVSNHSTICMTIKSAPVDLIAEMNRVNATRPSYDKDHVVVGNTTVNPYHYDKSFSESLKTISDIMSVLNNGNWNRSDSMTDYFDVGWYVDLNIGRWDKAFVVK